MIDLHTHILPGLDDGPPTPDGAVSMARAAIRAGTRAVATTSHINLGFGLRVDEIAAAREALTERLAADGIALELLAGGEVAPERLPDLDDDTLAGLSLGGGGCILLECPFTPVGASMEPIVANLHSRGFTVLLAHPERSATFQRELARLGRLIELGAHAQVTSGAVAGGFGNTAQRAALAFLEAGLVHVLASDSHDARHRPPDPRLGAEVLIKRYGDVEEQMQWMTDAVPAALVAGASLPPRPPLLRPRGLRSKLRSWSAR